MGEQQAVIPTPQTKHTPKMAGAGTAWVLFTLASAVFVALGEPIPLRSCAGRCNLDRDVDYVVVGGGPAGMVVAERLSQDPSVNILLLEAGPDGTNEPLINTPAYGPQLTGTQYVWNFTSQPDPNLGGRAPALTQGHAWGGGSAVNYMAYCRGAPSVFDEWANISGDNGLSWASLFEDFQATSRYQVQSLNYDPSSNISAYGKGPLEVTSPVDDLGFSQRYVSALKETLGLSNADLNDGTGLGVSSGPSTIKASNRTRDYALPAYGWQMANRNNLRMIPNALVSKIGFIGNRASNITYHSSVDNTTQTIVAKEIILAAGALNSPKLLMLSGVGPKEHIEELGISVVADIPLIGSNLYDHHFSNLEYEVKQGVQTSWQYTDNATFKAIAKEEYASNSSGPLGESAGGAFALARVPDAVFNAVNDTFHPSLPADRAQLLFQETNAAFISGSSNLSIISPFVALVQPEASGYLRLNSSNFKDDPLIFSNYYGSPGDKAAMLYGYKKLREVMTNKQTEQVLVREVFPGANVTSDEQIWKAIQMSARSFHHVLGTVALGKVLDSSWRVKGLEGIRVVDSSSFPSPPTCHLQATVYAYAHHVAGVIRRDDKMEMGFCTRPA